MVMKSVGAMHTYKYYRPPADYSKYLGPDWKAEYSGASTIVTNHSGWMVSLNSNEV
jgi:hypothetical protein